MNIENTEESLSSSYGKENPFRVPAGYFDRFAEQMMERLPEQTPAVAQSHSIWRWLRPALAAAVVVGVVATVGIYLFDQEQAPQPVASPSAAPLMSSAASDHGSDELEQTADYLMIDEQDMYAYISGE